MLTSSNPVSLSPENVTGRHSLGAARLQRSRLPIVDVSSLFREDTRAIERTAQEIGRAARSNGFLYVAGHGIPGDLLAEVYRQAEQFFAQPESEKLRLRAGSTRHHRGYVPTSDRGLYLDEQGERHYEAFDLGLEIASDHPAARDSFLLGPNLWPELSDFRQVLTRYYDLITRLADRLCMAFELDLGLEPGFFARRMRTPSSQLRLIHYLENQAPPNDADMNMGAHTDYECFTILSQSAHGLQVMDMDDNWVQAPPVPGTFVINIGDMIETWTNGTYKATLHRVVNYGRERFSVPYFAALDEDTLVQPLPQFVTPAQPAHYRALRAGEHLLSQMVRDFGYMRERIAAGEMSRRYLPSAQVSRFERRGPAAAIDQRIAA